MEKISTNRAPAAIGPYSQAVKTENMIFLSGQIPIDPETGETITETVCIREAYDAEEYILNPDYDPTKEYVPREQRPEFDYVSNWGKLVLVDDGTCEVNGFATVGNGGKATKADKQTAYRVMERRDDTHIYVSVG